MSWRAVGCGTLAASVFVAVGLFAILRAEPSPVAGFQTRAGLSTFTVWVDPADAPAASSDPLPDRIALECGDGTFQAYRRAAG